MRISRTVVAYSVILLLLLILAYPALGWLVRSWLSNPYYSHGFLVPVISALLAWRQWRFLRAEPRRAENLLGLIVLLLSLGVVIWAMRWQDYAISLVALVGLLGGIFLFLEGWPRLRHWLFPLLFLLLMIPFPFVDQLSPWLASFTARWATALARLFGVAAVQSGGEITLPGTTLVVGAPCSGLRSLVTMFTVGVLWVYLVEGRPAAKAVMLAAIVPLAALSNILRITLLLIIAVAFGTEAALGYYHDWSSPLFFLTALVLLLLLGKGLKCWRIRDDIF